MAFAVIALLLILIDVFSVVFADVVLQMLLSGVLRARSLQLLIHNTHLAIYLVCSILDYVKIGTQLLLSTAKLINSLLLLLLLGLSDFLEVLEDLSDLLLVGGDALLEKK